MSALIGIYGASGCGRGIMPLARAVAEAAGARLVFIDDGAASDLMNGHPVMPFDAFVAQPEETKSAALAIAAPAVRARLAARCDAAGIALQSVWAREVVVMDDVEIGEGALVSPFVVVTSNIRIGRAFHANLHCYVEHDCVIGDFVTFAPSVRCNGNVHVGDHAYIGAGAILKQGTPNRPLRIGAGATVGMGAVVTKDVAPGVTVIGNPARPMEKK